jgi:hypothetical protein
LIRALAWKEVFSSTDHTMAFSGGLRYRPHTSAAFPEVGVVASHPRLDLPRLEVQSPPDSPYLHCPTRRAVRWRLGDGFDQRQHVIVVVHKRTTGPLLVVQTGKARSGVTFPRPPRPPRPSCNACRPSRRYPDYSGRSRPTARYAPSELSELRSCLLGSRTPTPHDHQHATPTQEDASQG